MSRESHSAIGVTLLLFVFHLPCLANDEQLSAQELVNRAMRAQVAAQDDKSKFEYLLSELEKGDTRTYRVIESDTGDVQRLIAINDQELTPQQRAYEDQWSEKLLADPSIQKNRQKEDAEEAARRQKIIIVLGEAFLYEIEVLNRTEVLFVCIFDQTLTSMRAPAKQECVPAWKAQCGLISKQSDSSAPKEL
jgi:hypothetical protein